MLRYYYYDFNDIGIFNHDNGFSSDIFYSKLGT